MTEAVLSRRNYSGLATTSFACEFSARVVLSHNHRTPRPPESMAAQAKPFSMYSAATELHLSAIVSPAEATTTKEKCRPPRTVWGLFGLISWEKEKLPREVQATQIRGPNETCKFKCPNRTRVRNWPDNRFRREHRAGPG